jgi:uncharacterized protein YndB with AHSA1/START domain
MTADAKTETRDRFSVNRTLDAPRELVWSALTDPEQLVNFWGPEGTRVPLDSITVEPRQGGAFRLTMVLVTDGTEFPMDAVYREFDEPERMVFETAGGIVGTIELADLGDGRTEFTWTTEADFDEELLANAKQGTNSAADQLVAHLATLRS